MMKIKMLSRVSFFKRCGSFQPQKPRKQQQSFNYAPAPLEERKQAFLPTPTNVQYFDYEEEAPRTQKPIQIARPKYAVPRPPPPPPPQPQRRPPPQQFGDDFGIVYAPERPAQQAPQYQSYDSRQPVQFPEATTPTPPMTSRADQFSLFSPAPRADSYKSKVRLRKRKVKKYLRRGRRRRKRKPVYYILKKKKFRVF